MKSYRIFMASGLILFLAALLLGGCAANPVTGQQELMLISEDQEIRMGNQFYPNALWIGEGGGGEYKDERLRPYLSDIVSRIHQVSHRPQLPITFAIQNSSVPNAWAIPGHIAITRGLLASLDTEGEFVFVMGHEIGHISARHAARQQTYRLLVQLGLVVGGLALGDKEYAPAVLGLGVLGGGLLLRKYSRGDELEADRLGVLYLSRTGYDLRNAVSAHRNLQQASNDYLRSLGKEPKEKNFFEELLATHPRTQTRIEEIQLLTAQTPQAAIRGDGINRQPFHKAIAEIKRVNRVYQEYYDPAVRAYQKNNLKEAVHLLNQAISLNDRQPPFHTLNGLIQMKSQNFSKAEQNFNRALALDRDYQPALKGLGLLHFQQKNYAQGIGYLQQGLKLFPNDVVIHQFLGLGYFVLKSYREAIPHLKVFAEASPTNPVVHGILGLCYEVGGDRGAAYQQYHLQLKVSPDSDLGRQAYSRIEILKPLVEGTKGDKK